MRVILIGVGQSLRGDDAAGLQAVHTWQLKYPQTAQHQDIQIELAQLPGLALLDLISGAEAAIIVDAVHSSAPPGTLHILSAYDLKEYGAGSATAHGWGVAETLALGNQLELDTLPAEIKLIGIEGEDFEPGDHLSPVVEKSLSEAIELIEAQVQLLLHKLPR